LGSRRLRSRTDDRAAARARPDVRRDSGRLTLQTPARLSLARCNADTHRTSSSACAIAW
jgi:hypothetical protein